MSNRIVSYAIMLVVIFSLTMPISKASNHTVNSPRDLNPNQENNNQQSGQNERIVSAEIARRIQQEGDQIEENLIKNQDQNFQTLDGRITRYLSNTRTQVIIGSVGGAMLAGGLVAWIVVRSMRKYSFEAYQQEVISKQQQQLQENYSENYEGMRDEEWYPEEPKDTFSRDYGQKEASNTTRMNAWQAKAPHQDGWKSPIADEDDDYVKESSFQRDKPEFDYFQGGYDDEYDDEEYYEDEYYEDDY